MDSLRDGVLIWDGGQGGKHQKVVTSGVLNADKTDTVSIGGIPMAGANELILNQGG